MTDQELLKLAAQAAGYDDAEYQEGEWMEIRYGFAAAMWSDKLHDETSQGYWNPLTDDGDALRLVVKLGLHLTNGEKYAWASQIAVNATETMGKCPYAATRRAIVRAAAEIGKGKG